MSGPLFLDTVDGVSGVDTGDIPASLRFRGAATAYCTRTFGTPTNKSKWTLSFWVKRAELSRQQILFSAAINASANFSTEFSATNNFQIYFTNTLAIVSSEVERDPTSWVHFVISYDSGNSTAANRCRVWKNGTEITSWSTDNRASIGTSNDAWNTNALLHLIGNSNAPYKNDDYKSRIAFIDGTAVTDASSFGYLNTEINEWVSKSQSAVKAVVDAGGTNSFMLDFDDGTSLVTLGYDKSSKGNNWTLNNFSLTAGTSYDWMLDVPGNSFATLSPLKRFPSNFTTWSNGNLQVSENSSSQVTAIMTQSIPDSGKWYFECHMVDVSNSTVGSGSNVVGVAPESSVTGTGHIFNTGSYRSGNPILNLAGVAQTSGATYASGDVIGVAVDQSAGSVQFYKNGVAQGATPSFTFTAGTQLWPFVGGDNAAGLKTYSMLFGQAPLHASATYHSAAGGYFRYAPPTGYKALCQRNLPDPAILNPEKHFDVLTWAGNNSYPRQITGLLFPPDFVQAKSRSNAYEWTQSDSVRGTSGVLRSNSTAAESVGDQYGYFSSFNSDGFTIADGVNAINVLNDTGVANVAHCWKAGGAAVTNNAGSITSQVSANVDAGFSIVTATTPTSGAFSIGHGLGVAPKLVIAFNRTTGTSSTVYHAGLNGGNPGTSYYLQLNSTNGQASAAGVWGSVGVTSSLIGMTVGVTFTASQNIVLYCFAEIAGFSKIFSYTGNGSADGPFVHCGFKPKFVLIKESSAAGNNWQLYDSVRDPSNQMTNMLFPNTSGAESTGFNMDFLSNGFKSRLAGTGVNTNGNTYIGIAFADVPAKYALAR